jgi:hypothetical protein
MGPFIMYMTLTKWLWNFHVGKLDKNTMGMGMHKFVKQMEKPDLNNWVDYNLWKMVDCDIELKALWTSICSTT